MTLEEQVALLLADRATAARQGTCRWCDHSYRKKWWHENRVYCFSCVPEGYKATVKRGKLQPTPGARLRAEILKDPCVYCGQAAEHVDHVVPMSAGGSFTEGNLAPACGPCNRAKGTMFVIEFKQWLKAIRSESLRLAV